MAAGDFSNTPPDAIAHHRAAQAFLDAEPKTALRQLIRAKENSEVGTRAPLPGAIHSIEFTAPHQPRVAREFQARFTRA